MLVQPVRVRLGKDLLKVAVLASVLSTNAARVGTQGFGSSQPTSPAPVLPSADAPSVQLAPSPFSGGFGLSLPIALPQAVGRAQPPISITYSHQRGNGNAGMGWSVQSASISSRPKKGIGDGSSFEFLLALGGATVELVEIRESVFRDRHDALRIEAAQFEQRIGGQAPTPR